jgi:hypothetical protein
VRFGGESMFLNYSDAQFLNVLHRTIESYLKFKRACDIAKQILKDNCHDFFITIDSTERDSNYSSVMYAANQRNIPVDFSIYSLECSLEEVAYILNTMCGLELFWLDEHRYIFDNEQNGSYLDEEDRVVSFYNNLISNLSLEQISAAKESLDDQYILYL